MSTYGRCPVCNRVRRVLKNGIMADHRRPPDDKLAVIWPVCAGSRKTTMVE